MCITFTANINHIYTLHKFNYIKYGNLKIFKLIRTSYCTGK